MNKIHSPRLIFLYMYSSTIWWLLFSCKTVSIEYSIILVHECGMFGYRYVIQCELLTVDRYAKWIIITHILVGHSRNSEYAAKF